jgi:RNA polymerase II subunit A small phosphatase-like protein
MPEINNVDHEKQVSEATTAETAQPTATSTTLNTGQPPAGAESTTAQTATTVSADKEKASISNTDAEAAREHPTAPPRSPSRSQMNSNHAATEANPSSSSVSPSKKQKKPSLLSHLVHVLLPCIGPSKAYDLEGGEEKKGGNGAKPSKSGEPSKMKAIDKESSGSLQSAKRPEPIDTSIGLVPVVPSQHTPTRGVPPSPSDPAVIVPPTPPSHVLPRDETGGVTSGAVQPPGSTGDESRRSSRHGTDFGVDDESEENAGALAPVQDDLTDEDDEEERLIREGGAGIPIGPVCLGNNSYFFTRSLNRYV